MKKIFFLFILCLSVISCGSGLNPEEINGSNSSSGSSGNSGNGNLSGDGFGNSKKADGVWVPGMWKEGVWTAYPNGLTGDNSRTALIYTAALVGSDIYAPGYSFDPLNNHVPGYWKNGVWVALDNVVSGTPRQMDARRIVVSGSDIYLTGYCYSLNRGVLWTNGVMTLLQENPATRSFIFALGLLDANVYAGGYSEGAAVNEEPGYFINNVWTDLPLGVNGGRVLDIAFSGSDVYAAGINYVMETGSPKDELGYWKNNIWNALPNSEGTRWGSADTIVVDSGDIYVSGDARLSSQVTGIKVPGYWKNGVWETLINGETNDKSQTATIKELIISNSDVYAYGYSVNASGKRVPGFWKNGSWTGLLNGETGDNSQDAEMVYPLY